jgi:hypothetical protein
MPVKKRDVRDLKMQQIEMTCGRKTLNPPPYFP